MTCVRVTERPGEKNKVVHFEYEDLNVVYFYTNTFPELENYDALDYPKLLRYIHVLHKKIGRNHTENHDIWIKNLKAKWWCKNTFCIGGSVHQPLLEHNLIPERTASFWPSVL